MKPTLHKRVLLAWAACVLPAIGCVTTNQFKDFVRTEIALIAAQVISDPIDNSFQSLVGPQVIEEVVPSI